MPEASEEERKAGKPAVAEDAGRLWLAPERLRRDEVPRLCGASGWALRLACTDGTGHAVCPVCSQRVRTRPGENPRLPLCIVVEHPL